MPEPRTITRETPGPPALEASVESSRERARRRQRGPGEQQDRQQHRRDGDDAARQCTHTSSSARRAATSRRHSSTSQHQRIWSWCWPSAVRSARRSCAFSDRAELADGGVAARVLLGHARLQAVHAERLEGEPQNQPAGVLEEALAPPRRSERDAPLRRAETGRELANLHQAHRVVVAVRDDREAGVAPRLTLPRRRGDEAGEPVRHLGRGRHEPGDFGRRDERQQRRSVFGSKLAEGDACAAEFRELVPPGFDRWGGGPGRRGRRCPQNACEGDGRIVHVRIPAKCRVIPGERAMCASVAEDTDCTGVAEQGDGHQDESAVVVANSRMESELRARCRAVHRCRAPRSGRK